MTRRIREDAPSEEVSRRWLLWAKLMMLHRGKVVAALAALSGCVGAGASALGIRYIGPQQDIARVEGKVDAIGSRVGQLERSSLDAREARSDINHRLNFLVYVQCVQLRRTDPAAAVPALCNETPSPPSR